MNCIKKMFCVTLSAIIILSFFAVLPVASFAASEVKSGKTGDLTWSYNSDTNTLTFSGKGKAKSYGLSSDIPWNSFGKEIKTIIIGKDVEELQQFSLVVCKNVTEYSVDGDNSYYKGVDNYLYSKDGTILYRYTTNTLYQGFVDLPSGVKEIASYAFSGCPWLYRVVLPETVEKIGASAFANCSSFQILDFASGIKVKEIPDCCFQNCGTFEKIYNFSNIESIGRYAFANCEKLEGFKIPETVTKLGNNAFEHARLSPEFTVPERVTEIPSGCFKKAFIGSNEKFRIKLPSTLTTIGVSAFEDSSVNGIIEYSEDESSDPDYTTIPRSVKKIPTKAFYNAAIGKLKLQDGIEEISSYAFASSNLYSVEAPDTITYIGSGIIEDTPYEEEYGHRESGAIYFGNYIVAKVKNYSGDITIREGTVGLSDSSLTGADKSETISIPASLKIIPDCALPYSGQFKNIVLDENNPNYCTVDGILYSKDMTRLVVCPNKNEIKKVKIPDSVTDISRMAFSYCESIEEVELPDTIETLKSGAFCGCGNLNTVNIPKNIKNISSQCFSGDGSLTEILLPEGLTSIDGFAFNGCSSLKSVNFPSTLKTVDSRAFYNCESLEKIELNEGLTAVKSYAFKNCKLISELKLPSTLTEIGQSAFEGWANLEEINVPDSVSSLGSNAFWGCCKAEKAEISSAITYANSGLFVNCTNLKTIKFRSELTGVGEKAFSCCFKLEKIEGIDNLTYIGPAAFKSCSSLNGYTIPSGIKAINEEAFRNAANITLDDSKNKLEYIYYNAFYGAKNLNIISLGNKLKKIDVNAFESSDIASIELPDSITSIGDYAFQNCKKLVNIKIPCSIQKVPPYCFYGCSSLKTATLSEGTTYINHYGFSQCTSLEKVYVLDKKCKADETRAFYGTSKIKDVYLAATDKNIDEQEEDVKTVYRNWNRIRNKMPNTTFHFNYDPATATPDEVPTTVTTETTETPTLPVQNDSVYVAGNGERIDLTEKTLRAADDTSLTGITNEFKNLEILGVQKKEDESKRDIRFVTVINNEVLKDAEDYGYIAVGALDKETARTALESYLLDKAPANHIFSCKGTSNKISGEYGKSDVDTKYKYVTFVVNNIGDFSVGVIFYVKNKDGKVYYAPYTNSSGTYKNCVTDWNALTR